MDLTLTNKYHFIPLIISPKMKPNIPNIIPALIAAIVACEIEKELLIKSQTKNTIPPNTPIKKQVNMA